MINIQVDTGATVTRQLANSPQGGVNPAPFVCPVDTLPAGLQVTVSAAGLVSVSAGVATPAGSYEAKICYQSSCHTGTDCEDRGNNCQPVTIVVDQVAECNECVDQPITRTAQEILNSMVANGGLHEQPVERVSTLSGSRFTRSNVIQGADGGGLPDRAGNGLVVYNENWIINEILAWFTAWELAGTSGTGNKALMLGAARVLLFSSSQDRWNIAGTFDAMANGGFSSRGVIPHDVGVPSAFNAEDTTVGTCRRMRWDANSSTDTAGGLMGHGWAGRLPFNDADTCGVWVQMKFRECCIDPALPLGDGGFLVGAGSDLYTEDGYGPDDGTNDMNFPVGSGFSRLKVATPDWQIVDQFNVEGAGEVFALTGGRTPSGCQTMTQQKFLDSLAAQPELLTF